MQLLREREKRLAAQKAQEAAEAEEAARQQEQEEADEQARQQAEQQEKEEKQQAAEQWRQQAKEREAELSRKEEEFRQAFQEESAQHEEWLEQARKDDLWHWQQTGPHEMKREWGQTPPKPPTPRGHHGGECHQAHESPRWAGRHEKNTSRSAYDDQDEQQSGNKRTDIGVWLRSVRMAQYEEQFELSGYRYLEDLVKGN